MALYLALLLFAVLAMVSIRTCSSSSKSWRGYLSEHSDGDTIDVAIEYSPLSLYRYADTLGGFNYDILRSIMTENRVRFKFHPMVSLSRGLEGLEDGTFDVIVADMPMSADFMENFVYTEPVYLDRQVLVQLRDSTGRKPIESQLDLAGKEVWVPANSPIGSRIRNLASEIGDTIIVMQDDEYGSEQLFLLTATGEIGLSVVNERVAKALVKDYPNVDIGTDVSFTQFQSWLMRKDDGAMTDSINSMIVRFKNSDVYKSLVKRYFK